MQPRGLEGPVAAGTGGKYLFNGVCSEFGNQALLFAHKKILTPKVSGDLSAAVEDDTQVGLLILQVAVDVFHMVGTNAGQGTARIEDGGAVAGDVVEGEQWRHPQFLVCEKPAMTPEVRPVFLDCPPPQFEYHGGWLKAGGADLAAESALTAAVDVGRTPRPES
jgi:hypothetical protein